MFQIYMIGGGRGLLALQANAAEETPVAFMPLLLTTKNILIPH